MDGLHIEMAILSSKVNLYELCSVFSSFLLNIPILYPLEIKGSLMISGGMKLQQ